MFTSGHYAAIIDYMTEYAVMEDFLDVAGVSGLPGLPTLDLVLGEEVELLHKVDGELPRQLSSRHTLLTMNQNTGVTAA